MQTRSFVTVLTLGVAASGLIAIGCGGAMDDAAGGSRKTVSLDALDICGTPEPSEQEKAKVELEISKTRASLPQAITTIPVYVHIITSDTGQGDISDEVIAAQIAGLNLSYSGQQGAGSYNTNFRFAFVSTDRTANSVWWTCARDSPEDVAMKTALRKGSADDLNLYIRDLAPGLGGYGGFPWWYAGAPIMDGPVLDYAGVSTSTDPALAGDLAVHEVGHWMGLYHTFQGGCDKKNDYVSDTPAQANYTWGCPVGAPDTCTRGGFPGVDPIRNFMNYTEDACKWEFTQGQSQRMDQMWATYRQGK